MEILVVEDNVPSRKLLKKLIENMGHQVIEASDGQQAWQIIKNGSVRMVISDWIMPEMDGLALCNRVRNESLDHYIYIIMLTTKNSNQDLVKILESGADDHIPKPFNPDELRARILTGARVIKLEDDHLRLQHTLIQSRNKLTVVFDALQEQIVVVDTACRIISANKAFVLVAGNENAEISDLYETNFGQIDEKLLPNKKQLHAFINTVFATGKITKKMMHQKFEDNETYKEVQCLPVKDKQGNVMQVVMVIKDLSEERRQSREIESLNKKLVKSFADIEQKNEKLETALENLEQTQAQMVQSEKMASIGQLAAGVAHEINNPTGFVSSNLKSLGDYQNIFNQLFQKYRSAIDQIVVLPENDPLPSSILGTCSDIKAFEQSKNVDFLLEDVDGLIADCREGIDRIAQIVLDLKDFAHPGEDKVQSVDVNAGLESTLNVVNNELKYKATVHRDYGKIPNVLGYPQQLNQVFMNILVNAAQAIEKQGEIRISTRSNNGSVQVAISDTGCGIPKDNFHKVFDPFYTTKEVGKGTGLGMNIAYNIIQKHHGKILIDSEVGKGTTFTISIPADEGV